MKNISIIIFLLAFCGISAQDIVTLEPIPTCTNDCTGSLNIMIDPSLLDPDQTLPFDVEITNVATQESYDYTMSQYQQLINGSFFCEGDYEIVIHLSEYCTWTGEFTIESSDQNTFPLSASVTHATEVGLCKNGAIDLTIDTPGDYNYYWIYYETGGASDSKYLSDTEDVSNLGGGHTYCVTVTDEFCGVATQCWDIVCCWETNLALSHSCETGCIDLSINNSNNDFYNVVWKFNGNIIQTASNIDGYDGQEDLCIVENSGEYTVEVSSQCGTVESSIVVDPCACIDVELTYLGNVESCQYPSQQSNSGGISINVTGTTNYTVLWSNGGTGTSINKLVTGWYTATITSGNCTITRSYQICCCDYDSENPPISPVVLCAESEGEFAITDADVFSPSTATSYDGSITVIAPGAKSYVWFSEGSVVGYGKTLSGLGPGTYCVQVLTGCGEESDYECYTLVDCSQVNINVSGSVTNTCQGYSVGAVSVAVSGGIAPYKYFWSNGSKSAAISKLAQGQYCVTVSDASGCKGNACFTVGLNQLVTIRNGCVFTTTCNAIVVSSINIGSYTEVNPLDCRYRDSYCNDRYYLGSTFVGTRLVDVGNCTIEERCLTNNQLYQIHDGSLVTGTVGPAFDPSGCFLCHSYSYCYFPSLNIATNLQQIFNGIVTQIPGDTRCDEGGDQFNCYVKVYCNGQYVGEGCDENCDISACFLRLGRESGIYNNLDLQDSEEVTQGGETKVLYNLQNNFGDKKVSVIIKPNPANDYIEISGEVLSDLDNLKISIYSFNGEQILTLKEVNLKNGICQVQIDNLAPGPYRVVLFKSGGVVFQSTIIKI